MDGLIFKRINHASMLAACATGEIQAPDFSEIHETMEKGGPLFTVLSVLAISAKGMQMAIDAMRTPEQRKTARRKKAARKVSPYSVKQWKKQRGRA